MTPEELRQVLKAWNEPDSGVVGGSPCDRPVRLREVAALTRRLLGALETIRADGDLVGIDTMHEIDGILGPPGEPR